MEGVYISILLCWRRPGWFGSVNSSSSMGAPFSTMNATRTPSDGLLGGIRISRPASSEARSATSGYVRNLPDQIRDRRVRFETHPLHAKFAFLVADDKEFQVFQVSLARLHFSSGNSDVMVPAHCLSTRWNRHKFYAIVTAFETARPRDPTLKNTKSSCTSLVFAQGRFGMHDAPPFVIR